jgi:enoyl-CoA hydratase/carnithine racemase
MKLEDYQNRFKHIKFRRKDGIIELTIHYDNKSAKWSGNPGSLHSELPEAFYAINQDPENKFLIFTGVGEEFLASWEPTFRDDNTVSGAFWHRIYKEGKELLNNLLEIEVPIIAAVNGEAHIHPELPTLCDIVIASETASFADKAHLSGGNGTVPGDGSHIWWPMLLGPNRGRSFLYTGEVIPAAEAKTLGFVAEVVPQHQVLSRAWELARDLMRHDPLVLKYSRISLTQHIKRRFHDDLGYGLQLEGLAVLQVFPASNRE